jgi:hypothetical protein
MLSSREPSASSTLSVSPAADLCVEAPSSQDSIDDTTPRAGYEVIPQEPIINPPDQTTAGYQTVDDDFSTFSPLPVSCRQVPYSFYACY